MRHSSVSARPDRDDYIKIYHENILPQLENRFKKQYAFYVVNNSDIYGLNLNAIPYDYTSVAHGDARYGTKNLLPTMEAVYVGKTFGRAARFRFEHINFTVPM
jgi:hypothetical protein